MKNSIQEINQQQNNVNLPGQTFSESSSKEIISQQSDELQNLTGKEIDGNERSNSSTEFDIEAFRQQKLNQQKSSELVNGQYNEDRNNQNILKLFGIRFEIEILQERNKDPLLFIKCLLCGIIIIQFLLIVTFVVGLFYKPIPIILCMFALVFASTSQISTCKKSIKNKLKIDTNIILSILVMSTSYMLLFVYSYLVQMPFNSVPLFLLLCYLQLIVFNINAALLVTPNRTAFDDPNYQLKFFSERVMSGFFNGTGIIDALSDIVLGIQLIQQSSTKFLIIGIFLFVLCNADYIQVIRRVLTPGKVSLWKQLYIVFVEVIVLVLTTIVLLDVSKISLAGENEDFLFVTVISITTTIVNFLHNLVLVFSTIFSFGENKFIV